MKIVLIVSLCISTLLSFNIKKSRLSDVTITSGQMPNLTIDKKGMLHLVYGSGDSIMYTSSSDKGQSFIRPSLVAVLPKLAASHTRGPQLAVTGDGLVMTACNSLGDIFSYTKNKAGQWERRGKVNDVDTVAKENLMALSADGLNAFAVWLDLRHKHNEIFGAQSFDGGKTWSKNKLIYASPDITVCECCKPSVAVKGNHVYVMFRNWLNGNRDLYLIHSADGGKSFGKAQKLGTGSWALNGCPMDGGGLALDEQGKPQTVFNRKGQIIAYEPGQAEKTLGEGRSCTLEAVNGKEVYTWVEKGEVVVLLPDGKKKSLGKGQQPVLKAIDKQQVLCVWENEKQIHKEIILL